MNQWFGPGNRWPSNQNYPEPVNKNVSFSSNVPLGEALYRIKLYQTAYNTKYKYAINYTLLGVSEIDGVSDDLLEFFDARPIELLPQKPEDFD